VDGDEHSFWRKGSIISRLDRCTKDVAGLTSFAASLSQAVRSPRLTCMKTFVVHIACSQLRLILLDLASHTNQLGSLRASSMKSSRDYEGGYLKSISTSGSSSALPSEQLYDASSSPCHRLRTNDSQARYYINLPRYLIIPSTITRDCLLLHT
jgi:hypothetical protein